MLKRVAAAAVASLLLAGCGDAARRPDAQAPPPKLTARDPAITSVDRPTPRDYAPALRIYRRHVRHELDAMQRELRRLRAAGAAGDLRAARLAWLRASGHYETIGAAYGAFGALDAAINGRPAGLPGGTSSPEFTGLHRVEYALWRQRSTRAAAAPARRLSRDVARLHTRLAQTTLDPFEYSLRAHEVLEDSLHLQLSGRASPWSDSALNALAANVSGTRVVLDSLAGLIRQHDPSGALGASRRALARLREELARLRHKDGSYPGWTTVTPAVRERVDGLTAAAAEELAYVPELIDPRPARPIQTPFR